MRRLLLAATLALAACGENQTHPAGGGSADAPPLACLPNLDGQIDAHEARAALGVAASYRVATERTVDLAGMTDAAGHLVWDFAGALDDPQVQAVAAPLAAQWYAADFPAGEFVSSDGGVDSVYGQDDLALWLYGLASTAMDPADGRTLLVYDQPVPVLRFPLAPGLAWTATGSTPAGTLRGLPYVGADRYDVSVDAVGQAALPELTFTQALRVRTLVTVMPALGGATTRRQVSLVFECFGEVVRAVSRADEPNENFTTAATLRRLAL